jgi:hypothetical protein
VSAVFDVIAATISIRPLQRAHSRTSRKNTRQIREAQGNRFGRFGGVAAPNRGCGLGAAGSVDGTIPALAANAGAKTPNYAERSIMRSAATCASRSLRVGGQLTAPRDLDSSA